MIVEAQGIGGAVSLIDSEALGSIGVNKALAYQFCEGCASLEAAGELDERLLP